MVVINLYACSHVMSCLINLSCFLMSGIRNILHEIKSLREALTKLRVEETKLKEDGGLSGEQIRKLRQQQRKLREQEAKLRSLRKEFYLEHGFPLGAGEEDTRVHDQGVDNVNGTCNADGGRAHVYREYNSNGGRQGYPKRKVQRYVVKAKQPSSSGAATDQVHHTPEDKITSDSGSEAPVEIDQEEAVTSTNADAAPTSGIAG